MLTPPLLRRNIVRSTSSCLASRLVSSKPLALTFTFAVNMTTKATPDKAGRTPSEPRPSASVIVINGQNEVLLVQRNPKSRSFAGAHVFPGGNFDPVQDGSLELTAIRELFEETGLLLASPLTGDRNRTPSNKTLDTARELVHSQQLQFRDFLSRHALAPHVKSLLPFTQWVTPPSIPRRFRTSFYVAFLEDRTTEFEGFAAGKKHDRLPTPDGGQEVIAARFVHPLAALAESRAHEIALMPPQVYLLTTLAEILEGSTRTAAQVTAVRTLSGGAFGRMTVQPRMLPEKDAEGRAILTYEGDETRGGLNGRLHRCLVRFDKQGVATEVVIQRNFDIYTDLQESRGRSEPSKL